MTCKIRAMSSFSEYLKTLAEECGPLGPFVPGTVVYGEFNESANVILEDVPYYAEWINNGKANQLHIYYADDDDRIVGFSIWWLKDLISKEPLLDERRPADPPPSG